jgi:DTW domain-containing protein YfiP
MALDACARCGKPPDVCVCDAIQPTSCDTALLVLQHPQEQDHLLGTVPLLRASLPVRVAVGLSWPNLGAALGAPARPEAWATVFPRPGAPGRHDARGEPTARPFEGIVLLDGTWSQAKTLWWRNPWLLRLGRIGLSPSAPSIYGRLRREPSRAHLSTLEAAAEALVANGENPTLATSLRRAMRTLAQRVRDRA